MLESKLKILDRLIFFFICLFAATLTNSIFLNQIGYFGALVLAAMRAFFSQKRFEKTGLEWAFILFIAAEALSTLFSGQPSASALLMTKRILLIPIVYTIVYAADDSKTVRIFFMVYITAAVLTALAYIIVAREHLLRNLYVLHANGPSPFNHVMSAGGLLAILVVVIFTFVIDGRISRTYRWLLCFGLLISITALIASYTRAAWLAAAAGVIVVSIFRKKWSALAAVMIFIAGCAFLVEEKSDVYIYTFAGGEFSQTSLISTNGNAYQVTPGGNTIIVSDYEDGIVSIGNNGIRSKYLLPAPVLSCIEWRETLFVASLIDSRLILLHRNDSSSFEIEKIFSAPGLLRATGIANGMLYTLDKDSGVTIFRDPYNTDDRIRYPLPAQFQNMNIDEHYLTLSSFKDTVALYSLSNGIPRRELFRGPAGSPVGCSFTFNDNLYIATLRSLERYRIDTAGITLIERQDGLGGIIDFAPMQGAMVLAGTPGLVMAAVNRNDSLKVLQKTTLDYFPRKVRVSGNNIYLIDRQRNRLLSIADPDYPTNYQRLRMWETGWRIFKAHPIFGIGDMDVATTYAQFKQPYERENFGHLHNNYIQFLVIFGIVGTLAVLFLLGKTLYTEIRIFQSIQKIQIFSTIVLGAAGATIAFLVNGLGEWNFGDQESITMVWFLLGMSLAIRKFTEHHTIIGDKNGQ